MKTTRGDRLRMARERLYRFSTEAARALGIAPSTYNSHERAQLPGGRDYSPEEARKYARFFKVQASWLLTGEGQTPKVPRDGHLDSADVLPEIKRNTTLIKGYVGASTGSGSLYNFASDQFEEIDRPRFANDQTVAVEIKGKSNGPLMEGMLVFYDDVRSPVTDDLVGALCVVGLADDRILLKKILRGPGGSFRLLSNSNEEPPIENAKIEWAAKMIAIAPR
jgi:phage repressor protein C with HTH and peptisase S24 domain